MFEIPKSLTVCRSDIVSSFFLWSEMEVKEEKVQQLLKQLEIKTSDTQKFRTAAEAAKVNKSP